MSQEKKTVVNQTTILLFAIVGGSVLSDLLKLLIPIFDSNMLLKSLVDIVFIFAAFISLTYNQSENKSIKSSHTLPVIISVILGVSLFDTLLLQYLSEILPIVVESQIVYMVYMSIGILLVYKIISTISGKMNN